MHALILEETEHGFKSLPEIGQLIGEQELVANYTTGNVPDELRAEIENQVRAEDRNLEESDFPIAAVQGKGGWEIMFSVGLTLAKKAQEAINDEPYLIMHLHGKTGMQNPITKRDPKLEG